MNEVLFCGNEILKKTLLLKCKAYVGRRLFCARHVDRSVFGRTTEHVQSNHRLKQLNYFKNSREFLQVRKRTSSVSYVSKNFRGEVDKYRAVWVDLNEQDHLNLKVTSEQQFETILEASLKIWKDQNLNAVWLKIPIHMGNCLSVAARFGFEYHHAEQKEATLFLWLESLVENKIPRFATHQVGVSGLVINENTMEVLVVQDKNRSRRLWKFPGGLSELGEDISSTAEREVFEETGLVTKFQSVLAFRQQHDQPGAFGRSDIYILCRLKPVTFELNPCSEEIEACEWMSLERLQQEVEASSISHRLAQLVIYGLTHGFHDVDITPTQMANFWNKNRKFHLFHRPLLTEKS